MLLYNGVLLIRTLYLVPFARYSTCKISVRDLDLSGSPKVKCFTFFGNPIWDFVMTFCWYELYLVPFARYLASKISVSYLDLSGSPKVKYFYFFRKPMCHFIMVCCWYELSITYCLQDIPHLRFRLVTLTFQGHQRSNISTFLESPCATL